ncbi:MAG: ATP synthase F1 subunit delta [Planctomycetota bacterium]|nr:ATP synthase F1 subunit delta [Planctomycetota bacterium]
MIQDVIAIRYAKGLVAAATEKKELERTHVDMLRLADILDPDAGDISVPELLDFLETPTVSLKDKIEMTDVLCEKLQIGKIVSEFLNVLLRHRRVGLISAIMRNYAEISMEFENIYEAQVQSAKRLDDADREQLIKSLEKKLGKKVRLMVGVNRGLIAGVRVKIGDMMLDETVKGRLARLRETLRK